MDNSNIILAELCDVCVDMELVEDIKELEGKRKAELVTIIRDHLSQYRCDPTNFDLAAAGPIVPCNNDEELSPTSSTFRVGLQQWFKNLSVSLEMEQDEWEVARREMSTYLYPAESYLSGLVWQDRVSTVEEDLYAHFYVDFQRIKFLMDLGSNVNILPSQYGTGRKLEENPSMSTNVTHPVTRCFVITDVGSTNTGVSSHPEFFLHLNENTHTRYMHAPVPLALPELVADELRDMEDRGSFSRVESSVWVSPIVAVLKPYGKVRICADFTHDLSHRG
ncbi:unnamed protein product [Lepeophtheirus salmonis]|uniref:(salmon louse) hypothetical protein n=1 Tax=Lepeophtheirus salmonis TaxID=72036 RepID=A0A7R8CF16_LEPSM|nr:unnamed protein product [Lepeophtheirus salmonis]CAF2801843.1 unnamed protein product [Lepeophtheirus salmonis]